MSEQPNIRIAYHNKGKVKSTKAFVPWTLVYIEEAGERVEARIREKYYKSTTGKKKIRKIIADKFA